jgi:hypothetical protein
MGPIRGSPTKAQPSPGKGPSQLDEGGTTVFSHDYKGKLYYKRSPVRDLDPLGMDFFQSRGVESFSKFFEGHVGKLEDLGDWFFQHLEDNLLHTKYGETTYLEGGREARVVEKGALETFFEVQPAVMVGADVQPVCLTWDKEKVEQAKGFNVGKDGYLRVNVGWTKELPRPDPKPPSRASSRPRPATQGKWNKRHTVLLYVHQLVAFLACGPFPQYDPTQASSSNDAHHHPLKLETLHFCDNRSCLAPAHLLRGSHLENLMVVRLTEGTRERDAVYSKAFGERRRFLLSNVEVVGVGY